MDWGNYVGIPFLPDGRDAQGTDCWGLVVLVYREQLGIMLPLYNGIFTDQSPQTYLRIARLMQEERRHWRPVDKAQPYDVLLLRTGAHAFHVGLVVGKDMMLHIEEKTASIIEPYTSPLWRQRIEGVFRHD